LHTKAGGAQPPQAGSATPTRGDGVLFVMLGSILASYAIVGVALYALVAAIV
jgi:hypothetical protein